ncbi:response regulator transcription factor [Streptococcus cuniculipharyngis]|uniref:Response regulator transcription factor n=1 Tax=Streptococcus cuniculipharyngis TaxID=1562651 RepID=A0A5C5SDE9_9STRE|nr:response regulator transcription factor [Streptococcus cuniculipharyngis]TWS98794.1 response regulator transcription factor [Streptococcus cuniculipharyngis]
MNLFVLEDDFRQQSRIENVLFKLLEKHNLSPDKFEILGKPDQLFDLIEERGQHQLFFLDIEIKKEELKGFQVAKQIRLIDPYATIVFVTTHSEFMPLSFRYQVAALDYIDKELEPNEFEVRLEKALLYVMEKACITVAEDSFYFKSKYAQVQCPFEEIYYIETSSRSHRVVLYTKTDRLEFTANLADILKQEKRLLQCHRSFIINPKNIIKVDRHAKLVYFPNGKTCFISRKKLGQVLKVIEELHLN